MSRLFDLPDIQFVEIDPDEILNEVIKVYEAITGKPLFPGDPVRLFLLAMTNYIIQQNVRFNDSARQNLLRYARGDILDHKGAGSDTPRLEPTAAWTTVRFHLAEPRTSAVPVAVGTRGTPGNDIFFATATYAEISPGYLYADVPSTCLQSGTVGNGFLPGQINILVDPIPFIDRVENITESAGGSDREADDPYRERIYTAPERFSVAGPTGAYEYWARTASADIADVMVYSPAPVEVEIRVLMKNGELPTQDILDAVLAACNDDQRRPLTDLVRVLAPEVVNFDINATYWIDKRNATDAILIQQAANQALQDYINWQKQRIGRDINPSELTRRLMNAGARRVEIAEPVYRVLDRTEVAIADQANLAFGGLEDD